MSGSSCFRTTCLFFSSRVAAPNFSEPRTARRARRSSRDRCDSFAGARLAESLRFQYVGRSAVRGHCATHRREGASGARSPEPEWGALSAPLFHSSNTELSARDRRARSQLSGTARESHRREARARITRHSRSMSGEVAGKRSHIPPQAWQFASRSSPASASAMSETAAVGRSAPV